jgi:hypothetical protein
VKRNMTFAGPESGKDEGSSKVVNTSQQYRLLGG